LRPLRHSIMIMLFVSVQTVPCVAQSDSAAAEHERESRRPVTEAVEHEREYHRLVTEAEERDSMLTALNRRQVEELAARYETKRREREIALLEREQRQRELQLAQREADIALMRQRREERKRETELLAQEQSIRQLELQRTQDALTARQLKLLEQHEERVRNQDTLRLQEIALERASLQRGVIGTGIVIVLLLLAVGYQMFRRRRTVMQLREQHAARHANILETQLQTDAAAAESRRITAEREFAMQLIRAQEEERSRIAGALHDGISQDLIIMKFRAAMAQKDDAAAGEHITEIAESAAESIEEVRRISRDLRPSQLERVGLTATIDSMLRSVRESTALEIDAQISAMDGLFSPDQEIGFYRIVQEAMNNILRHAHAHRVEVQLQSDDGVLRLMIHDDGRGFDPATTENGNGGLGLKSMRTRAQMLGGELRIESGSRSGTTLWCEIPLQPETAESAS